MKNADEDEDGWKRRLSPEVYGVLRSGCTERPYSGKLLYNDRNGIYICAGCGAELFCSDDKFDSGCGWPSFSAPATNTATAEREDRSHGMVRTEVMCANCGGHLGHVFDDGPPPTGLRYCINSMSLEFREAK